jgi:hypothetical protein
MTAPGKNLEFSTGPVFKKRVQGLAGMEGSVVACLSNQPPSALELHGVSAFEIGIEGLAYGVVCRRTGQRVCLLGIYALPKERLAFEKRFAEWVALYAPQKRSGS